MRTPDPKEGWLARNLDVDASVVIDTEKLSKPGATERPGLGAQLGAQFFGGWGFLAFWLWLGALLERTDKVDFSQLIWYALGSLGLALGFALYYWGVRSAVRRATKEDTER